MLCHKVAVNRTPRTSLSKKMPSPMNTLSRFSYRRLKIHELLLAWDAGKANEKLRKGMIISSVETFRHQLLLRSFMLCTVSKVR